MKLLVATLLYIFTTILLIKGVGISEITLMYFIVINYSLAAIFTFIYIFPKTSEKIKEKIIKFCSHK